MDELERCVLVKPEVFMYRIPPRQSARGYRAADWNLTAPDWTGRLRCMVKGSMLTIRLEDKNSGNLFAACPVEQFPGTSVEAVTDSSRYFVICVKDDTGRKAFIGIGFSDRSDSFDLNVALQDHFKQIRKEESFHQEEVQPSPKPALDLAFKDGQTIRVNINMPKREQPRRANTISGAAISVLPPPPGSSGAGRLATKAPGPPSTSVIQSTELSNVDLLGSLSCAAVNADTALAAAQPSSNLFDNDPWGDFTSAGSAATSGSWEQF